MTEPYADFFNPKEAHAELDAASVRYLAEGQTYINTVRHVPTGLRAALEHTDKLRRVANVAHAHQKNINLHLADLIVRLGKELGSLLEANEALAKQTSEVIAENMKLSATPMESEE